jgi:hypothetical protein
VARTRKTAAAEEQPAEERPPLYDPAVHTDPAQPVFTELYCACGGLWRQRDPVAVVAPMVAWFTAKHTGDGHGPASKADCIAERETRREAAFRAAGKAGEYRPREHPHIDITSSELRSWPQLPEES